jgi:hypothetical protein
MRNRDMKKLSPFKRSRPFLLVALGLSAFLACETDSNKNKRVFITDINSAVPGQRGDFVASATITYNRGQGPVTESFTGTVTVTWQTAGGGQASGEYDGVLASDSSGNLLVLGPNNLTSEQVAFTTWTATQQGGDPTTADVTTDIHAAIIFVEPLETPIDEVGYFSITGLAGTTQVIPADLLFTITGSAPITSMPNGAGTVLGTVTQIDPAPKTIREFTGGGDGTSFSDGDNYDPPGPIGATDTIVIPEGKAVSVGTPEAVAGVMSRGSLAVQATLTTSYLWINEALALDESVTPSFTASDTAILFGSGAVIDLGPGTDAHTVTVDRNLVFYDSDPEGHGATINIDVAGPTDHDQLTINGKAMGTLNFTVRLVPGHLPFSPGDSLLIAGFQSAPQGPSLTANFIFPETFDENLTFELDVDNAAGQVRLNAVELPGTAGPIVLGGENQANVTTTGNQNQPAVAIASNGDFVIAYTAFNLAGGSGQEVAIRFFDADLTPKNGEIAVTTAAGNQTHADLAVNPTTSEVLVVFQEDDVAGGVAGQRYTMAGTPVGGTFSIFAAPAKNPAVDMDAVSYVVAAEDGADVILQKFNSSDTPVGGPVMANTSTIGSPASPAIGWDDTNGAVVAWNATANAVLRHFGTDLFATTGENPAFSAFQTIEPVVDRAAAADSDAIAALRTLVTTQLLYRETDKSGNPLGDDLVANVAPVSSTFQNDPFAVTGDNFDRSLLAWTGCGNRIYLREVDVGGTFNGGERIISSAGSAASDPVVAMNDAGQYVVAYTLDGKDGDGDGVFFQYRQWDQFLPAGIDDKQVNLTTTGDQQNGTAAATPTGFLNFFEDNSTGDFDIVVRVVDADGNGVGAESTVNTQTTGDQINPATDTNGTITPVVWYDQNDDAVKGRIYDTSSGTPLTGEIQVSVSAIGTFTFPAVTVDENGNVLAGWTTTDDVLVVQLDQSGTPQTGEVSVKDTPGGSPANVALSVDRDAGVAFAAWEETGFDAGGKGVVGQRFGSLVSAIGANLQVNIAEVADQFDPTVSCNRDGICVVGFTDNSSGDDDAKFRFFQDGSPLGGDFNLATNKAGNQNQVSVRLTENNNGFLVAWTDDDPADDTGSNGKDVEIRHYNLFNAFPVKFLPVDKEFRGNNFTANDQDNPKVVLSVDETRAIFLFDSFLADGSGGGVYDLVVELPPKDDDNDQSPNVCDICGGSDDREDEDGDGVPDGCDACQGTAAGQPVDSDGCTGDLLAFPKAGKPARMHTHLGNAVLNLREDGKVGVHNIGNTGSDGVTIDVLDQSFNDGGFTVLAKFDGLDQPGAVVAVFTGIKKNGGMSSLGGSVALRKQLTTLDVEADFSPIGNSFVAIDFCLNGMAVGSPIVKPNGKVGDIPCDAKVDYIRTFGTADWGYEIGFRDPVTFTPNGGGSPVVVDAIKVRPDVLMVTVEKIVNFDFIALNMNSILICDEFEGPPLHITDITPAPNSHNVSATGPFTVTFDQDIDPATIDGDSLVVRASQTGMLLNPADYTVVVLASGITILPVNPAKPGEEIEVTVTPDVQGFDGETLVPGSIHQMKVGVTSTTSGQFNDSGQPLGTFITSDIALADLNRDGHLDIVTSSLDNASGVIYVNNGNGGYLDPMNVLGFGPAAPTLSLTLSDADFDGDTDIVTMNATGHPHLVYLNDGSGSFPTTGELASNFPDSTYLTLLSLNADGLIDAVLGQGTKSGYVFILENDGSGGFDWTSEVNPVNPGSTGTRRFFVDATGVIRADVDGDKDPDLMLPIQSPNIVLINDGDGFFTDSGQALGDSESAAIDMGDLDGDGDMDAFVANKNGEPNKVWLNDGTGIFTDSGQSLGTADSRDVKLGDLDGDGDLDAFVVNQSPNTIWLNNGFAAFTDSGQTLGNSASEAVALGDVDGDGDLDAVVANADGPDRVWLNQTCPGLLKNADCDGDGDVDGIDFSVFASCFNKAGNAPRTFGCPPAWQTGFDFDHDGDIDGIDFSVFASCYNKAGNPPRSPCSCP